METSPTICDTVKQYSGYFAINNSTKNYFYWFFESRSQPSTDPVTLWMTGGPGCSSAVALFGENGPCTVNKDLSTSSNPYSWNTFSNLLYIDQPAGTGFSYGSFPSDYDHDEAGVSEDMFHFLQLFFSAHPEYQKQDFYAFGESYAGHFIPATTHRVWQGNQQSEGVHINLVGVSVGNGLTDPEVQYQYYADMAYNNKVRPIVSKSTYESMKSAIPGCVSQITKCQTETSACSGAEMTCNSAMLSPVQETGINLYDIREQCQNPPLCYDFSAVSSFLNQASTKKELGTTGHSWSDCNQIVNMMFASDWMKNFQTQFPDMLASNIRVLIYAGDVDFICNYMGNKAWTLAMEWPHKADFNAAVDTEWSANGKTAGMARSSNGFTFLQVYDAGHMVPRDQPAAALEMLRTFLNNKPF
jgi:cathepsin A (carboxypeptidase C)